MKIKEIFEKDVQRTIKGVIQAGDADHVGIEVEEYVLTNEAAKELDKLLAAYTNYTVDNGVWISGFFGSGKSHMLKMLAHLLGDVAGQDFPREEVSQAFRSKADGAFLPGLIVKADKIPAMGILFNIAEEEEAITKDTTDRLFRVFVKVFDEFRGYFGKNAFVARFERDLDASGLYEEFQAAFLKLHGSSWLDVRETYIILGSKVDRAYAEVFGGDAPTNILKQYSNDYSVSIEEFAKEVTAWIDQQPAGFRLNFFVDEVGMFIGDDTKLMLSLATIAEALNKEAKGRSWVFVTSQEDMDKIIGDQTKRQAQDFSRIQARFNTRVKLTSQDVEEVIRKRLLEKNETGAQLLKAVYHGESANFRTLFEFTDGALVYKNYPRDDLFIGTYPFVTYQFPLLQQAIEALSEHNAFEGKHVSVGERSLLGVVQHVANVVGPLEIGTLASFDQMFEGIRSSLKGAPKMQVQLAEQNLDNKLAIRLIKALFLVKYVESFKATVRNLTILVYDRFGLDLPSLQEQVREALALLEQQTYIQRSGDIYAYLSNEEQDIEKEIKGVDVDSSEVSEYLFQKLLFVHVMKQQTKFRYSKTSQDFPFGYMLDDVAKGQAKDLTLHFISPFNSNDLDNIRLQGAGNSELRVILAEDPRLISDLALLIKTAKYVKQKQGAAATDSVKRVLDQKAQEIVSREKELAERIKEAVGKAKLFYNATEVQSASTVADIRIADGMNVLVGKTYLQLELLGGKTYPETDVAKYSQSDDGGLPGIASEMENPADELYKMGVLAKDKLGEPVTVKKLIEQFQAKPYGWDYGSILCAIAYLYGQGKIIIELDAANLKRTEVAKELRNTQKNASLVIRKQAAFDPSKVKAFSDFIKDFFDEANPPKDPVELAQHGAERLKAKLEQLNGIVATSRFAFIGALQQPIELLESVVGKAPTWYVTEFSGGDELIEAKNNVLVPVDQFTHGPQAETYDDAQSFLVSFAANLVYLPLDAAATARGLLEDPEIFRGNKANRLKVAIEQLRLQMEEAITQVRTKTLSSISASRAELEATEYFELAPQDAQRKALSEIEIYVNSLEQQSSIAELRFAPTSFSNSVVPRLLQELVEAKVVAEKAEAESGETIGDSKLGTGHGAEIAAKPVVQFVPISDVSVQGVKAVLATIEDVDAYVEALRTLLTTAIAEGKRITR